MTKRISRRRFITNIAKTGTTVCACGLTGCASFTKIGKTPAIPSEACKIENAMLEVDLTRVPQLQKTGGSVKMIDPRLPEPIIIARTGEKDYSVLSIKCPHRGVEVEYKHDKKQFRCASLGSSTFAQDGTLKKGFARKSLRKFAVQLSEEGNRLIINIA